MRRTAVTIHPPKEQKPRYLVGDKWQRGTITDESPW